MVIIEGIVNTRVLGRIFVYSVVIGVHDESSASLGCKVLLRTLC